MKRFILNISVLLILVALLSSSVFASAIMPMSDGALDIAYVEMEENQYNSILYAIEALAEVPSSLKTGWSYSYPAGFASSWYYKVITLLDTIADNTANISSGSGSSSSGSSGDPNLKIGWTTSYPTGYANSWYYRVVSLLNSIYSKIPSSSSSSSSTIPSSLQNGWLSDTPASLYTSWYARVISEIEDSSASIIELFTRTENNPLAPIGYLPMIHYDLYDYILPLEESIAGNMAAVRDYVYFIMERVVAKPYEDEIKETQLDEREALYNVLSSDSRVDDIGSVFSLKNDFSAFFAVDGADVSQVFSQIEEGSSQWFSQSTADALSVGGGVSAASSDDPVSDTPLLDQRMSEIASYFTGGE